MRDAFEAVALWLAPSEFLRQRFAAAGFDPEHIAVSALGIELERYQRRPRQRSLDRALRVGFIGSVQPIKGVHIFIEAVRHLQEAGVEIDAAIAGDLSSKPEYVEELTKSLGPRLHLIGRLDIDRVPEFLDSLDALVVPSVWWENSPLVIQEAQAAALPVIASDIGGMAELVRHDRDGLLFSVGDPEALAEALRRLVEEDGLLRRLSAAAPLPQAMADDLRFHERLYISVIEMDRDPE